ncbi:MAG: winged helix-turn-helix transcriptional regulator [Candidatus Thorarchaeota archaeon]
MTKKLCLILVFSLVTSGVFSFFYFSSINQTIDFAVQDMSPSSNGGILSLNLQTLAAPISSGTSVLFPGILTKAFSPSTIFALSLATVVIDRKTEEKAPKLRDVIVLEIYENPGIHLRELQRNVGCAMGALQYHLRNLEQCNDIMSVKVGNSKHFFASDYSPDDQVLKLSALSRNPTIRTILSEVFEKGRVTQAELSRTMSLDKSLISYYTGTLLDAEILNTVRVFGRERPLILSEWAHTTIQNLALV